MRLFAFILLALGCTSLINAQNSPVAKLATEHVQELTARSDHLYDIVVEINIYNLFIQGPRVALYITTKMIPEALNVLLTLTSTGNKFDDMDGGILAEKIITFIRVLKKLLHALIGRFGLFSSFNFAEPIKASLVILDKTIDEFAKSAMRLDPAWENILRTQFSSLDLAMKKTIEDYSTNWPRVLDDDSSAEDYSAEEYNAGAELTVNENYQGGSKYDDNLEHTEQTGGLRE